MSEETKPLTGIEKARAAMAEKRRRIAAGELPTLNRPKGPGVTIPRKGRRAKSRPAAAPQLTEAPTLADLGLGAPEEDLRIDDILSNEEIEAIRKRAEEDVAKERRTTRAKLFLESAKEEARRKHGMLPADEAREKEMNEPTFIRINLPRLRLANGRECPPDPIIIDQRVFSHMWSGYVPRHQYEYLMDLMNKAWMHVAQVDGRTKTYYNEQLGTMVYQGGAAMGSGRAA